MKKHTYSLGLFIIGFIITLIAVVLYTTPVARAVNYDGGKTSADYSKETSWKDSSGGVHTGNYGSGDPNPSREGGGNFTGYGGLTSYAGHSYTNTSTLSSTEVLTRLKALLEQLNALKAQLAALKAKVGGGDTNPSTNDPGTRNDGTHDGANCRALLNLGNFHKGMSGSGVRTIQKFLVEEGEMTSDNATGYFGILTEQALQRWQSNHGVVASGTASTTGYGVFGARTRSAMARFCENHDGDQVSTFRLSPSFGKAPLTVEIAGVPASVLKKINECKYSVGFNGASGNGLTIDWGDGHESPDPATGSNRNTSCVNDVKKHKYTKPGVYSVKIHSWHPGPTDAPVTDWRGTARVTVIADEDEDITENDGQKVSNNTPAAIKARTALAKKLDVFTTTISIDEVRRREWPNSCLGLEEDNESCTLETVDGYRVTMTKASTTYYARTDHTGSDVQFEE